MDMNILGNLSLIAILLPLFLGLYLLFSRLSLSYINKGILNNSNIFINSISFIFFLCSYFISKNNEVFYKSFEIFSFEKYSLNFGIRVDENNFLFLIITSFLFLLFSLFTKKYFKERKQFIFTKQRFYIYLNFLAFSIYVFFISTNLFQAIIFLSMQISLIYVFSYLDIFKNSTNHNSTRFNRISIIGNFAFIIISLILLKYSIYSQNEYDTSLSFSQLNPLIDFTCQVATTFENYLLYFCCFLLISSRLMIFPLSCYYSFFANSSNVFYLSVNALANGLVGMFLFLQFISIFTISENHIFYISIFLAIGIIFALVQILFEQNIKIIFGYLTSAINSIFIILFFNFDCKIVLYSYFIYHIIQTLFLMNLFIKNKTNIPKRLISRYNNFFLEKIHINLFEKWSNLITKYTSFINKQIFEKFLVIFIDLFNVFTTKFIIKTSKKYIFNIIKIILISFASITLFAIYMTLFGGLN